MLLPRLKQCQWPPPPGSTGEPEATTIHLICIRANLRATSDKEKQDQSFSEPVPRPVDADKFLSLRFHWY